MSKRSWLGASAASMPASVPGENVVHLFDSVTRGIPGQLDLYPMTPVEYPGQLEAKMPQISRKVKACAACRKQKIKCSMGDAGPPCARCTERGLSCALNKSLQSIIDEGSQHREAVTQDLQMHHTVLQEVVRKLRMPPLGVLHSPVGDGLSPAAEGPTTAASERDGGPSRDNSPKLNPAEKKLRYAPGQSPYALTQLSALRSPDLKEVGRQPSLHSSDIIDDFISKGAIGVETAELLLSYFNNCLDHFVYGIGGRYKILDELRRKSPILTACICAVSALHGAQWNAVYGICRREFLRLTAAAMFDPQISCDTLRALCIASYWLADISWAMSGLAIRRAGELNLSHSYGRFISDGSEDAADRLRLWYALYICDQHLAIYHDRAPSIQEDDSLRGCEALLQSLPLNDDDTRLVSQVSLLLIMHKIRELGPDTEEAAVYSYASQVTILNSQLDQWFGKWSALIGEQNDNFGQLPRKVVELHYYFARLHSHSHVFRGLGENAVQMHSPGCASTAIKSAEAILAILTTEKDVQERIANMPSFIHSMAAFACTFLVGCSTRCGPDVVDSNKVYGFMKTLIQQFRFMSTGKWHFVHHMTGELERMARMFTRDRGAISPTAAHPPGLGKQSLSVPFIAQSRTPIGTLNLTPSTSTPVGVASRVSSSGLAPTSNPDWANSPVSATRNSGWLHKPIANAEDGSSYFDNINFGLSSMPGLCFDRSALAFGFQSPGN
ncbi:hypothetical protein QBC46DRAFT_358024 [Diplogelasinospora grovesii]|uniref:Zn(2)-C6 fungal-type domain-containing protein n=1 Tax=Diplogelasinospora grovesii TaxID=303347 RepID=A0AAN6S0P1_9PEZI|nr:hypothetical protein QBC46DRAFT_358024 [Diplogelasinospora grovesii]